MRQCKAFFHVNDIQKFIPLIHFESLFCAIGSGAVEQVILNFIHQRQNFSFQRIHSYHEFLFGISASDFNRL